MSSPTPHRRDAQLLREAFDSFSEISHSLEKAYEGLQGRVTSLSHELEETNRYLESLLESLPSGVIVRSSQDRITRMNHEARGMLGLIRLPLPATTEEVASASIAKEALLRAFSETPPSEMELSVPAEPRSHIVTCSWSAMPNGDRILLLQDITRLRELEGRVRRSERLAAMGEMALEVAHEIRNPLTGLGLFASLLAEGDLNGEDRRRYADNIQIGIRSLDTIVTNMLSYARSPEPRKQPLVLSELLRELSAFIEPLARGRSIAIDLRLEDRTPIEADPEMLRQAFMNLLLNAIQALPSEGRIELRTASSKTSVQAFVRDTGIGIPDDLREAVFEPRFTTNEKGNGLGLGIVKKVVAAHGGKVELRSRSGWGTEFALSFPRGAEG